MRIQRSDSRISEMEYRHRIFIRYKVITNIFSITRSIQTTVCACAWLSDGTGIIPNHFSDSGITQSKRIKSCGIQTLPDTIPYFANICGNYKISDFGRPNGIWSASNSRITIIPFVFTWGLNGIFITSCLYNIVVQIIRITHFTIRQHNRLLQFLIAMHIFLYEARTEVHVIRACIARL